MFNLFLFIKLHYANIDNIVKIYDFHKLMQLLAIEIIHGSAFSIGNR
jgi:hypothetical protein